MLTTEKGNIFQNIKLGWIQNTDNEAKVGPLFEVMLLNHFPECCKKLGLCDCLSATVIGLKVASAYHIPWSINWWLWSVGPPPGALAFLQSWLEMEVLTVHPRPIKSELSKIAPAVYADMNPLGN